jgi:hypothetical protein
MKIRSNILGKIMLGSGLVVALAFAAWPSGSVQAAEDLKGYERSLQMRGLQMRGIDTKKEAEALKPGDAIAMACVKCKSVAVEYVTLEKGHIKHVTPGVKHLCPGCNSAITVVGNGKGATRKVTHTCGACGDDSAFCCATKPGTGATKGMEKEKENKK